MKHPVANKEELMQLLKSNSEQILGYGVKQLSLFGSFVRNNGIRKKSDVDFIVEFSQPENSFRNLMDLGYFLEDLLGRKVELIPPQALSGRSGPQILKELENVQFGSVQDRPHS